MTEYGTEFACPNGTYSNVSKLGAISECQQCTPGMYCGTTALLEPTSVCSAGYFCGMGASVAQPHDSDGYHVSYSGETCVGVSDNSTNDICPPGHYCPVGSPAPVQCPPGTNTSSLGLSSVGECQACVKGYYCPLNGTVVATRQCLAGYFCPSGTSNPTDFDNLVCPTGHYCPVGVDYPIPCAAGTYQDERGNDTCKACPAGSYCEVNTTTPVDCPPGYLCEVGTRFATEFPCPKGSFQNMSGQALCTECLSGMYCPFDAMVFPEICRAGFYCPAGISNYSATPCPSGTFSNTEGLKISSECSSCTAGSYCSSTGLTQPEGECSPGYYCAFGAKTSTPTDNISGGLCGRGHACTGGAVSPFPVNNVGGYACPSSTQCSNGSAVPEGCPPGSFNPTEAVETCPLCPAGSLCPGNSTFPADCPMRFFCPEGSGVPTLCPNGTYGAAINLTSADECATCPPGYYCVDGTITGECAPGYFCRSGQDSPTPDHDLSTLSDDPAGQLIFLFEQDGGQCPPGHFCYAGTYDPFPCENATVRLATHGASPDDCGPCPAGYVCFDGDPVPDPCDPGYYCPVGETRIPCPTGHYNEFYSMSRPDDCLVCPAGSFCNATAISNPLEWPCPASEYCLNGTLDPLPCPAGSYRDELNADSLDACYECPGGFYCPRETDVYFSCPERTYCPPGSTNTTVCPASYYCPVNSVTPHLCPENYFCPINTAVPEPCYRGTFCPNGTSYPNLCSLGYKAIDESNFTLALLSDEGEACEACQPGEYGNSEDRLSCAMCTPGYVCLGATTTPTPTLDEHRGYICPKGAYCPEGSSKEILCPVGTFQPNFGESNSSACLNCEAGTYQDKEGQDSCFQCSSSSSSGEAATTCECVGQNRNFQPDDGWCVCVPGYEFINSDFEVSSDADGTVDCQPIVYDRCLDTQSRSVTGDCVDSASYCDSVCGANVGGSFIDEVGSCECNGLQNLDEICDENCLANQKTVTCKDGNLVIYDPVTDTSEAVSISALDTHGSLDCSVEDSSVYSVGTNDNGFEGQFGAGTVLEGETRRIRRRMSTKLEADLSMFANTNSNSSQLPFDTKYDMYGQSRALLTSNATTISNPLVCVKQGDSVVFAVSNTNYPVYEKDLLINTNLNFDYGAFRDLASNAMSSLVISAFSVTFSSAGVYGFSMSSQPDQLMVVTVMPPNVNCSVSTQFVPFSRTNLITMGITSEDEIVLSPDWNLIIGLTFGMMLVILFLIGFVYFFRKRSWTTHLQVKSRAREANRNGGLAPTKGGFHMKIKSGISSMSIKQKEHQEKSGAQSENEVREERGDGDAFFMHDVESAALAHESTAIEFDDDMMVPELASHMQKNHDTIDRQMHIQKDILAELKDGLKTDLDGLKEMLVSQSMSKMSSQKKLEMVLSKLKTSMMARGAFETSFQTDQVRVMHVFSRLQQLLEEGHAVITEQIIRQIDERADLTYEQQRQGSGPTTAGNVSSSVLLELTTELNNVKHLIDSSVVPAIAEEDARYKNAEKSFWQMVKNDVVTLPTPLLDQIRACITGDAETDEAINALARKLKVLSGQIPGVVTALATAQNVLGRVLLNALEIGNPDIGEKEKNVQASAITSRLLEIQEMFSYLNHDDVEDNLPNSVVAGCVDEASLRRRELELIVDDLLLQSAAEKATKPRRKKSRQHKKKGKRDESSSSESGSDSSSSSSDSGDDTGAVIPVSPRTRQRRGSQMFLQVESEVNNNSNNLSEAQKSELLDAVVQDVAIVDNILSVERENKEEMMKHIEEAAFVRPESGGGKEDEMARRHQEEQAELANKLRSEHMRRLNSIMNSERVVAADSDEESVRESMVLTFASTKYAILMRRHGCRARIRFSELHDAYEMKRVDLFRSIMEEGGSDTFDMRKGCDKLEKGIEALNTAERDALMALHEDVRVMRTRMEEEQDAVSEAWVVSWKTVELSEEIQRLREETKADFDEMKNSLNENSKKTNECAAIKQSLTTALVQRRIGLFDGALQTPIEECLERESELQLQVIEEHCKENFHVLAMVEQQVDKMLDLCTAWGPLVNSKQLQDKLHERVIASLHSYHDSMHRISENESNLRIEAAEMALFSKVSKMNVDEHAVSKVIMDFRALEKETADAMSVKSRQQQQGEVAKEQERQAQSVLDFERELACATELNALRYALLCVTTEESRLKTVRVVAEAMAVKKEYLLSECKKKKLPDYVYKMLSKQIDSEIQREEAELNAAYVFISCDILNTQRHASSITEGIVPGTALAKMNLSFSYNKGLYLYRESMGAEIARVSHKAFIIDDNFRSFEGDRLIQLEAPFDMLVSIEEDISLITAETVREVFVYCQKELSSIEGNMDRMLKTKLNNQDMLHWSIQNKLAEYESVQLEMNMSYKEDREAMQQSSSGLLSFDQRAAASASQCTLQFCDAMFDEWQLFLRRQAGLEKKEDIMSLKRNEKQQELESLEIALSQLRSQKLKKLMRTQQERRQEWVEEAWADDRNAHGLEVHLRARSEAAHTMLRQIFSARRAAREKVLLQEGLSAYDASLTAEQESKEFEEHEVEKLQASLALEEKKSRLDIRSDMDTKSKSTNKRYELLRECLPYGFHEFELRERAELRRDTEAEVKEVTRKLTLEEATPDERDNTLQQLTEKHAIGLRALSASQKLISPLVFKALEKEAAEETARILLRDKDDVQEVQYIKELMERSQDAFTLGLNSFEEKAKQTMELQIERALRARQDELQVNDGMAADDALAVAEEEFAPEREQMQKNLAVDMRRVADRLEDAVSRVAEDRLLEIGHAHEMAVNGLELSFKVKKAVHKNSLKKRLQMRKQRRERELLEAGGRSVSEVEQMLSKEFSANQQLAEQLEQELCDEQALSVKRQAEKAKHATASRMQYTYDDLDSSEASGLRKHLIREELLYARTGFEGFYQSIASALDLADSGSDFEVEVAALRKRYEAEIQDLQDKMQASKKESELRGGEAFDENSKRHAAMKLEGIRKGHDLAVEKLKDDILHQHKQSVARMKEKLAKKKASQLSAKGLTKEEEDRILNNIQREEQSQTTELNKLYESEKEIQVKEMRSQHSQIHEKLQKAIQSGDVTELYETEIQLKRGELAAAISSAVDAERAKHLQKAAAACLLKDNATIKLEGIRKEHDLAVEKLKDDILHQHKQSVARMKEKLAKKKASQLSAKGLTTEEEDHILENIQQEEQIQITKLNQNYESDKNDKVQELLSQQSRIQQKLQSIIQENEALQLAADGHEAALLANQAIKSRSEQETRRRDLMRIHQDHTEAASREKDLLSARRAKGEGNLKNRLAEKRAKKERELKQKEEEALAALALKQKEEQEEREKLRQAKITWSERIAEAAAAADEMGLDMRAKEDFCFTETLGKKLVPETHLSEATAVIMKKRHALEMKTLLDAHFEDRIAAIKKAVETVLQEKATARVELVDSLNSKNSTDDFIALSLSDLDDTFSKKQIEAEETVVLLRERENMASQVALRQQQLEEISSTISLYSDAESMSKLHTLSGRSRAEEISEYRANLEAETKEREQKIHHEREQRELLIREEHNKALEKMKAELEKKKKQDELDLELSRKMLENEHEEKTQKMNEMRKTLIKTKFEAAEVEKREALERTRLSQKSKMQQRRDALRNKRASGLIDIGATQLRQLSSMTGNGEGTILEEDEGESKHTESTSKPENAKQGGVVGSSPAMLKSMLKIEEKLGQIDRVIRALDSSGVGGGVLQKNAAETTTSAGVYLDGGNPPQGDELSKTPLDKLSVQEKARIQFGRRLAEMVGIQHLEIAAASSLPPSLLNNNSFKNSYHYDASSNTLYIHTSRLSSSGDFGLVAIHALSHIKTKPSDLSNDSDPAFMNEFYTNLRILSQDLYKHSQSKKTDSSTSQAGRPGHLSHAQRLMAAGQALSRSGSGLVEQVPELGGETPVHNPAVARGYFGVESMHERVKQYAQEGGVPVEFVDRYLKENE